MKRAVLMSAVAVLTLSLAGGVALAKEHKMGHGGNHGPRATFEQLDMNSDGKITPEEMEAHAKARFDAADSDKDGMLSTDEMKAQRMAKDDERMTKRMGKMMEKRDANGDGMLSFEEMHTGDRKARMMKHLDADSDGAISAEEFAQMQERGDKRHARGEKCDKGKSAD